MEKLRALHKGLKTCRKCPQMCGSAVHGPALDTRIMLIGQAPGVHEASLGQPFAYTAGQTLFKWLNAATGCAEEELRQLIYFSAVARCFPGKASNGSGDRVPSRSEVENCGENLRAEIMALKPSLVLAVGKVAITEVLKKNGDQKTFLLSDVIGKKIRANFHGQNLDVIPLPHPSGVSRWPKTAEGKQKLTDALRLVGQEFQRIESESSILR